MKKLSLLDWAALITFGVAFLVFVSTPAISVISESPLEFALLGYNYEPTQTATTEGYDLRIGYFLVPEDKPVFGYTYANVPIRLGGGLWFHLEYTKELSTSLIGLQGEFVYQTADKKKICDFRQTVSRGRLCNSIPYSK